MVSLQVSSWLPKLEVCIFPHFEFVLQMIIIVNIPVLPTYVTRSRAAVMMAWVGGGQVECLELLLKVCHLLICAPIY